MIEKLARQLYGQARGITVTDAMWHNLHSSIKAEFREYAVQVNQQYMDWFQGKILDLARLSPKEIANVLGNFDDFGTITKVAHAQLARAKERLLAALE